MTRQLGFAAAVALTAACTQSAFELSAPAPSRPSACVDASECQDGIECNGEELCEQGRCVAGPAPDCDDGDLCTADGCNEGQGCVHVALSRRMCQLPPAADAGADADAAATVVLDASLDASFHPAPSDPSRPPEVLCPTSVDGVSAGTNAVLERYRGVTCSAGAVQIGPDVTDLSALAQLRRAGALEYLGPSALLAGLSSLVRVDGTLKVGPRADTEPFTLPALRWVGGDLSVERSTRASTLFAQLSYVGGTLRVSEDPAADAGAGFALPALVAVGKNVEAAVAAVRSLRLPQLGVVQGTLDLGREGLAQDALAALRQVRTLQLWGSTRVALELPALTQVATLTLLGNPRLERLAFPALASSSRLDVRLNPRLSRCQVDALLLQSKRGLAATDSVCCNQGCDTCREATCSASGGPAAGQSTTLGPLTGVDRRFEPAAYASVEQTDRLEFDFFDLMPDPMPSFALREVKSLTLRDAPWQSLAGFSVLRSVGLLHLMNTELTSLTGLEGVESLGTLELTNNRNLIDISALDPARGALRSVTGSVSIEGNPALSQCEAARVAAALDALGDGGVRVYDNGACPDAGP